VPSAVVDVDLSNVVFIDAHGERLLRRMAQCGVAFDAGPAWIQRHMSELMRGAGQYTITIAAGLFDAFHKRGDPYRSSPATLGE